MSQPKYLTLYNELVTQRSTYDTEWQNIVDYLRPESDAFLVKANKGNVNRQRILDSTPERNTDDLANSLAAMLASSSKKWGKLTIADPTIDDNSPNYVLLGAYLEKASDKVLSYLAHHHSKFYPVITSVCYDLIVYGQAYVHMRTAYNEFGKKIIKFLRLPVQSCYLKRDMEGEITHLFYKITMTLDNILEKFNNLEKSPMPEHKKRDLLNDKMNFTKEKSVTQFITSKNRAKALGLEYSGKADYLSVYMLEDGTILEIEEYDYFPVVAPSWDRVSNSAYGRGPGHRALPDIETLNTMIHTNLVAAETMVTPPLIVPYDLMLNPKIDASPRALNFMNVSEASLGTGLTRPEALTVVANLPIGLEMEDRRKQQIAACFYADLLVDFKNAEMSATESTLRENSRVRKLYNPITRLEDELLAPIFLYCYRTLKKFGYLEVDEALDRLDVYASFTSALYDANNSSKVLQLERALASIANVKSLPPEIQQEFDMRKTLIYILEKSGADLNLLASAKDVEAKQAKRDNNEALMQAQQLSQITQGFSKSLDIRQG
jgi:hypothetical protein